MDILTFIFLFLLMGIVCTFIGIGIGKLILYISDKLKKGRYGLYVHYQPNPFGRSTTDCSIRAISKIMECSWDEALDVIVKYAKKYKDQTNCSTNLNTLLYEELGMHVFEPKKRITFEKFAKLHPEGTFALNSVGHICACVNGKLYDSWDSSRNKVEYYSSLVSGNPKDKDITLESKANVQTSFGYDD